MHLSQIFIDTHKQLDYWFRGRASHVLYILDVLVKQKLIFGYSRLNYFQFEHKDVRNDSMTRSSSASLMLLLLVSDSNTDRQCSVTDTDRQCSVTQTPGRGVMQCMEQWWRSPCGGTLGAGGNQDSTRKQTAGGGGRGGRGPLLVAINLAFIAKFSKVPKPV